MTTASVILHNCIIKHSITLCHPSDCFPLQVNNVFETSEEAVVRSCLRTSMDLSSMYFQVAGSLIMTFPLFFTVLTVIGTLASFLNPN
jgi:hypothetical protein